MDAELSDGERAELHFEGDQPLRGTTRLPGHGAGALMGPAPRRPGQDAQEESAGAYGGVGQRDVGGGRPRGSPQTVIRRSTSSTSRTIGARRP